MDNITSRQTIEISEWYDLRRHRTVHVYHRRQTSDRWHTMRHLSDCHQLTGRISLANPTSDINTKTQSRLAHCRQQRTQTIIIIIIIIINLLAQKHDRVDVKTNGETSTFQTQSSEHSSGPHAMIYRLSGLHAKYDTPYACPSNMWHCRTVSFSCIHIHTHRPPLIHLSHTDHPWSTCQSIFLLSLYIFLLTALANRLAFNYQTWYGGLPWCQLMANSTAKYGWGED